jgi:DNA mismatch repair protein MutL
MMKDKASESIIQVLPPEEARKIAAGEVVDRPAALLREFLDNAIDADATEIEANIEGGGAAKTEVIDNGEGMSREDLLICRLPHATSKIRSLDDLAVSHTLGFRGEALAAAAAVARLEILSSRDGREAWLLESNPGDLEPQVTQSRRTKGTTVRALGLFDTIPARKRFLKREGSEGTLCRQAFIDKALAFPERSFRFTQDGMMKDYFPPSTIRERFTAALLKNVESNFLRETSAGGQGFTVTIIAGGPELYRNDRRQQYVFANKRRINDYGLLQAMEYGLQGWFPNGTHPVGAVYIEIDPALADFNIHPAKREVRFADPGAIHHAVTQSLRNLVNKCDFDRSATGSGTEDSGTQGSQGADLFYGMHTADHEAIYGGSNEGHGRKYQGPASPSAALAMEALLENPPNFSPLPGRNAEGAAEDSDTAAEGGGKLRYAGRAFGLFILAEQGDRLFIIDQHAAHERILYDRFLSGPVPSQELLVPIPFETESAEDDRFLETAKDDLAILGVILERDGEAWNINALPAGWRIGDGETVKEILALKNAGENIARRWAATLSCHAAVRDGDYLDDAAALALAEEALALPVPRCPHGRPVWTELTREMLYKAVRRT